MIKFIIGIFIGASVSSAIAASDYVATECGQGLLEGYIVQDSNGAEVCRDPMTWYKFRGPNSYIVCPE